MTDLNIFTRNAEALAREMATENGVAAAMRVLEIEAAAARKEAAAVATKVSHSINVIAS